MRIAPTTRQEGRRRRLKVVAAEPFGDRLARRLRAWPARRPLVVASWLALAATVPAVFLVPESRRAFVELAWSEYLLWQAFVLARSKSLSWSACGGFLLAGALVAPLAALTPALEEPLKLLPLAAYLAGTGRARSLGVADVALAGFAAGTGFGLVEESLRALVGGDTAPRAVLALFPSPFATVAGRSFAGHAVTTGLVALGVGFALRFAPRWGRPVWALPAALLAGAVFDHTVYNGGTLPDWLVRVHEALGAGTGARPLLVAGLAGAVALDYRDLRRLRGLPLLPDGGRVGPLGELRAELMAAVCAVRVWVETCVFVRRRHQLGYALLDQRRAPGWGDPRPIVAEAPDPYDLVEHRRRLVALLVGAALLPGVVGAASIADLLGPVARWWDGLAWYEVPLVMGAAVTLFGIAFGHWAHPGDPPRTPAAQVVWGASALVDLGLQRLPRLRSALTRSARRELARRAPDVLRSRRGPTAARDAEILRENRQDIAGVVAPKGWRVHRLAPLQGPGVPLNHELNGVELPNPVSPEDQRRIYERLEQATDAREALAILRHAGARLRRGMPP